MSIHALIVAAYVEDLDAGRKWVLAAIADSADEYTRESAPGLPKIRAWSGLSESRAKSVVAELIAGGYIARIEAGRAGRRAVYKVFPKGMPAIPHPSEVAARFNPTQPVDNSGIQGATGGTLDELGCHERHIRVPPAVPLHALTSVSRGAPVSKPVETRRPAPPAPGFPGARRPAVDEDAQGIARRAKGAADQPCPRHPAEIVPCGRCAHAAAQSDPARIAAAAAEARRAIVSAKITTTTATEETAP